MKKKIFSLLFIILAVSLVFTAFAGCVSPLTEEEKEVVGKYQLTSISVKDHPEITADSFELYTMEFKSNRKCEIKRIDSTESYSATADWKMNSAGEIEVVTKIGRAKATEIFILEHIFISGTNTYAAAEGTIEMTLSFIKEEI